MTHASEAVLLAAELQNIIHSAGPWEREQLTRKLGRGLESFGWFWGGSRLLEFRGTWLNVFGLFEGLNLIHAESHGRKPGRPVFYPVFTAPQEFAKGLFGHVRRVEFDGRRCLHMHVPASL